MNFNKVILGGRLTRDVEVKDIGNDMKVAKFTVASSRPFKTGDGEQKEDVVFLDCELFGSRADVLAKYTSKGSQLLVEGRLKQDNWEDNEGNKRNKILLRVEDFQFVGAPKSGDGDTGKDSGPAKKSAGKPKATAGKGKNDDIPF